MATPKHYQGKDGIQPFDIIDAFDLGFNLGNCIKYICRADKKGERLSDLRKAMTYLQREMASAGLPPTVKPLGDHTYEPMISRSGSGELCRRCGQSENHGLHPVIITREELTSSPITPRDMARDDEADDA